MKLSKRHGCGSCQGATVKKLFAKKNLIVEVNFTNPVDSELFSV
jgi:hypothetical protein